MAIVQIPTIYTHASLQVLNHIRPFFGEFLSTDLKEINAVMSVNLLSYMYLTHAVSSALRASHGNIIFVSSVSAV